MGEAEAGEAEAGEAEAGEVEAGVKEEEDYLGIAVGSYCLVHF